MMTTFRVMMGLLLAAVILATVPGCGVGSAVQQDLQTAALTNPSPNYLGMADAEGTWAASGTGASRYSVVDSRGLQTFQQGSIPRDLLVRPDGTVVLSSGTDVAAKGIEFQRGDLKLKVAEFGTSASEPTRANNEALDRLAAYWAARDEAEKERQKAIIDQLSPTLRDLILGLIGG